MQSPFDVLALLAGIGIGYWRKPNLPDTWVIRIELYHEVARTGISAGRHYLHISPLRVLRADDCVRVGLTKATCENLHVVTVEMDLYGN